MGAGTRRECGSATAEIADGDCHARTAAAAGDRSTAASAVAGERDLQSLHRSDRMEFLRSGAALRAGPSAAQEMVVAVLAVGRQRKSDLLFLTENFCDAGGELR